MITVVGGIKGGGGKTTLATNLCVMKSYEGKKVLLVDADEQNTASDWASQRTSLGIETKWTTIQLNGRALHTELQKMSKHYDDVIVDVGGRDTTSQRSALIVAQLCLIPFKPKSFDMWTLGKVRAMINEIRLINPDLRVRCVINQADPRGNDTKEAIDMINEIEGIYCTPSSIGNRKSFANAASEGKGIVEMRNKDLKAIDELKLLYFSLYPA